MYDVIIIGAGPAGLTAALYAGRYRLKTLLLEKMGFGGQIVLSSVIENYPGFPGGIATGELINKFKQQVEELGIEIVMAQALEIEAKPASTGPTYNIKTQDESYETKCVIIASGAQPKRLGVPGEKQLTGRGVSYCGTCDGPLFKEKDICLVGAGDRAVEEAIFLTTYAKTVTLVHRRDKLRASKILEEKARSHPKIKFLLDSVIEEIVGQNKVEGVKIKNVKSGEAGIVPCQGVFIFVGIIPDTAFVNNLLNTDETGFIIVDHELKTSRQGIFACGDCVKKSLYQVVTACAEGAVAAASAQRYLG